MNKTLIVVLAIAGVLVSGVGITGCYTVNVLNTEGETRVLFETKQKDNQNEFDNTWKQISQVTQVTELQKNALKEIIVGNAEARTKGGGSLVQMVREAVPNQNPDSYGKLINIISSKRDGFTMRQKELLDIEREHNYPFEVFPENIVLSLFNRHKVTSVIVTSSRTEESFKTGKDDNIKL